jgi:hypothetical protein
MNKALSTTLIIPITARISSDVCNVTTIEQKCHILPRKVIYVL